MKKVVWGVLSTASIGMQKVLPAMQQSAWCDIRAIASRSLESARKAADKLGIERAYGSYEELLADSEFTRPTHHPKIRIARVAYVDAPRWATLQEWIGSEGCFDDDAVRRQMADLLPEYKPWKV